MAHKYHYFVKFVSVIHIHIYACVCVYICMYACYVSTGPQGKIYFSLLNVHKDALLWFFFPVYTLRNEIYNGYLHNCNSNYKKVIYRNMHVIWNWHVHHTVIPELSAPPFYTVLDNTTSQSSAVSKAHLHALWQMFFNRKT